MRNWSESGFNPEPTSQRHESALRTDDLIQGLMVNGRVCKVDLATGAVSAVNESGAPAKFVSVVVDFPASGNPAKWDIVGVDRAGPLREVPSEQPVAFLQGFTDGEIGPRYMLTEEGLYEHRPQYPDHPWLETSPTTDASIVTDLAGARLLEVQ